MTVHLYNLKSKILIKLFLLMFFCLYSTSNFAQHPENGSQLNQDLPKGTEPKAQNTPPKETLRDVTDNDRPVYVKCPKSEKCRPVNPVKTVSSQLIDNQFQNKEMQKKYEERLFEYEMWRLDFMAKLHTDQFEVTKQYGNFLFWSLLGVFVLLVLSIIISFFTGEKDSVFISIKDGSVKLKMNTLLFVLIVIILYLYHYYFTIIYPIN